MKAWKIFLPILVAIAAVPPVNAAIFTDRATFEATLGTKITDDYENPGYKSLQSNAAMSSVLGETKYTSTAYPNLSQNNHIELNANFVGHNYCAGCNGSFQLDFTSTSIGGGIGVFGVGFNFFNQESPFYTAFVTYGDGSTENISLAPAPYQFFKYFGVTSNLLISTIQFGLPNGVTTQEGSFGIDNLTIGNAAVPLPGSLGLFVSAVVGLFSTRRFARK